MTLELKHIDFSFSEEKVILKNLSLSIEENKVYALMGSNGAGKTTLFNLITGFLKPQNGTIYFEGTNITNKQPYKINRQGICRTFQNLRLITKLTVRENIVLAMQGNNSDKWYNSILNLKKDLVWNLIKERKSVKIADRFFLSNVLDNLAGEISYGQQKLLSLACCVANGASLLLLDEAVAGIQPEYRNKIAMLIKELKSQGKTILVIEHNTDFISEVSDKIFFMNEGSLSSFDNLESLRQDKLVMAAYI